MTARQVAGALLALMLAATGCAEYVTEPAPSGATADAELAVEAPTPTTTVVTERVLTSRTDTGDCLVGTEESFTDGGFIDRVACSVPHDLQVIARPDLAGDDGAWPGAARVAETADEACLAAFEATVGEPWAESSLDYVVLVPGPADWSDGRRAAHCAALSLSGAPLTRTLG